MVAIFFALGTSGQLLPGAAGRFQRLPKEKERDLFISKLGFTLLQIGEQFSSSRLTHQVPLLPKLTHHLPRLPSGSEPHIVTRHEVTDEKARMQRVQRVQEAKFLHFNLTACGCDMSTVSHRGVFGRHTPAPRRTTVGTRLRSRFLRRVKVGDSCVFCHPVGMGCKVFVFAGPQKASRRSCLSHVGGVLSERG